MHIYNKNNSLSTTPTFNQDFKDEKLKIDRNRTKEINKKTFFVVVEKMTCENCEAALNRYTQALKDGERLLCKLKDYQRELEHCQTWISETNKRQREASSLHEANFRQLLADLEELARCEEAAKNGDPVRFCLRFILIRHDRL